MNLVSVFLSCTACLPLIHMSKNILWVGALQGIQFWGCRQGMLLLWSNIFCMCARPTCSSSTVGPNDIPGAAAQPLPPHSVYVPHRESWASYLKFLPEKKKKTTWENCTWKHFVTHFMHYLPQNENTKVLWIHSNPDYKSDCKNLGLLLYILCGYAGRILIEVSAFLILMQIWFYFFLWLWGFFKFRYQSFKDPSEHLLVSTWSQTYFWNM